MPIMIIGVFNGPEGGVNDFTLDVPLLLWMLHTIFGKLQSKSIQTQVKFHSRSRTFSNGNAQWTTHDATKRDINIIVPESFKIKN